MKKWNAKKGSVSLLGVSILIGCFMGPAHVSAQTTLSVDYAKQTGSVTLFGGNSIFPHHADIFLNEDLSFKSGPLADIQAMKPGILRFPGGTISQHYRWKRAVGPKSSRLTQVLGLGDAAEESDWGPYEAALFCEEVGAELTVCYSWNDSARDMADWVEFYNAEVGANPNGGEDWAQVRADMGHPAPFNVHHWEVGNETAKDKTYWFTEEVAGGFSGRQALFGGVREFRQQALVRLDDWSTAGQLSTGATNETFYVQHPPIGELRQLSVGVDTNSTVVWTEVSENDMNLYGATDLVFYADRSSGKIVFGDGVNGARLPAGSKGYVDYLSGPHDGFVEYYRQMTAVDPSISIESAYWALSGMSKQPDRPLDFRIDGMVHHGSVNYDNAELVVPGDDFNHAIMRSALSLEPYLAYPSASINGLMPESRTMAMSEVRCVPDTKTIDNALGSLIGLERISRLSGNNPDTRTSSYVRPYYMVNYFANTMNNSHGQRSLYLTQYGEPIFSAEGVACQLMGNWFGQARVDSSYSSDTYTLDWLRGTTPQAANQVDKTICWASRDDDDNLYIMAINTTKDETLTVDVTVNNLPDALNGLNLSAATLLADSLTLQNVAATTNAIRLETDLSPDFLTIEDATHLSFTIDGASARVIKISNVSNANQAPSFGSPTYQTADVVAGQSYSDSLAGTAADPESDPLTYTKVVGPSWLVVAPDGALSGTAPTSDADVGLNRFTIRVSDGDKWDHTELFILVDNQNQAPDWGGETVVIAPGVSDVSYSASLAGLVSDPDGDSLTFQIISPNPGSSEHWLSLASDGTLSGTPPAEFEGINQITVLASDGKTGGATPVTIQLAVDATTTNVSPSFSPQLLVLDDAVEGEAYAGTVAVYAIDPNGDVLTFSEVTETAWLTVSSDGSYSGTPGAADVGLHTVEIEVDDQRGGTDRITLEITVSPLELIVWPGGIVAYWDGDQGYNAADKPPSWQHADLVNATLGTKGVSSHAWSGKGSTDATFGTVGSPAAPTNTLSWQVKGSESQTFSVQNISAIDLQLDSIHFDYANIFNNLTLELTYDSGDLSNTVGAVLTNFTMGASLGTVSDWNDADVDLSGALGDTILAAGETAVFKFAFVGGTSASGLDNLAISASLPSVAMPYNGWLASHFTPEQQADSSISGVLASPMNDAIPNLAKYALNLNPWIAGGIEPGWVSNNEWIIGFDRNPDATDTDLYLEMRTNLVQGIWEEIARSVGGGAITATNGALILQGDLGQTNGVGVQIQAPYSLETEPSGFIRFRIEKK